MSTRTDSDFKLNPIETCPCSTGGRLTGGVVTGGRPWGGLTGGRIGTTGTIGGLTTGGIKAIVAAGALKDGSTTMKPEALADGAISNDAASVNMDLIVTRFI